MLCHKMCDHQIPSAPPPLDHYRPPPAPPYQVDLPLRVAPSLQGNAPL